MWRAADRGDIVLGWLTKVVVAFSVVGALGFDGFSLLHAQVSVIDAADHAAIAARDVWLDTSNAEFAYAAAQRTAKDAGGTVPVDGMVIEPDGTVGVVVHKTARTFLLHHMDTFKSAANVTGRGRARPPT